MKNKLFILSILFTSTFVQAQESDLLNKYRTMALDYNYDIKAAEKNISASLELEKAARADLKPKLSGNANAKYIGNPTTLDLNLPGLDAPIGFEGENFNYGASLTLMQPIYTGGSILANIEMAKHQHALNVNVEENIRSAVYYQTTVQYWNTVARKEVLNITREFEQSVLKLTQTIQERVDVGLIDPQDLLMAEVKLNEAKYQYLQAANNLSMGRMALNSLVGITLSEQTTLDADIPKIADAYTILSVEATTHPELKIAMDKIEMQKSALKLTDSKYKAKVYIGADGSYSSPGYNFHKDLDPNYAVYAKVSVPIFEWGKRKNEKRISKQKIAMAEDAMYKTTDNIQLAIEQARIALSQAIERAKLAEASLAKANENERMSVEKYSEGKISIVEVLNAQVYKQTSQLNFVQAKLATQNEYASLVKALNRYDNQ